MSANQIIRVRKTGNFSVINNTGLQDERLSWGARGILAYLLSKPDDWQVRTLDLIASSPAGRDAVLHILRELEVGGYLHRLRVRSEGGRFEWRTEIFESPSLNPYVDGPAAKPESEDQASPEELEFPPAGQAEPPPPWTAFPDTVSPDTVSPDTVSPDTVKPPIYKVLKRINTDLPNTDLLNPDLLNPEPPELVPPEGDDTHTDLSAQPARAREVATEAPAARVCVVPLGGGRSDFTKPELRRYARNQSPPLGEGWVTHACRSGEWDAEVRRWGEQGEPVSVPRAHSPPPTNFERNMATINARIAELEEKKRARIAGAT